MNPLLSSPPMTRPMDRRPLRWFLPVVSGLLLIGVLIGFAKTFFLRSHFSVQPMPRYLYVHGVVLTTWFVLVLAQTCLVASRRTDVHRRLGIAAVAVAALVIPISTFVVVHAAQRAQGAITPLLRIEVVGDLFSLVWFAGFVAAAVYFRQRPDVHKRLMIASCFIIYGPVFARFQLVYGLPTPPPAVILPGLLVLATYDVVLGRRLQRVTLWIALLWIAGAVPLGLVIASGGADTIINALR